MPRKQRNRYRRFNFGAASRFNNKDAVEDRLLFQGQEAACGSAQAMPAVALVGDSVTPSWGGENSCMAQNGQHAATALSSEGENQASVSQEAAKMSVLLEEDLVTKWCSAKQQRGFVEDKDFISYLLFIVSEYETMTGTFVLQPVPTPKSPTKPVTRQQASKKRSYLFDEPDNEGKERAKKGKKRKKQSKVVRAASPLLVDVPPRPKSPVKEQLTEICEDNPKKEVAKIGKDSPRKEQVAEMYMYEGNPKEKLAEVCKDNPKKGQVAEIHKDNPKKEQVAEICKGSPKKEHFAERYKGNPKEQLAEICDNYLKYGVKKEQLAEICDNYLKYDVKKEQLAEICEDNPLDLSINSHKEESGEGKNTANTTGTSELQKILTDTKVTSGYDMEGQNAIPEEAILDFSTKKTSPDANANIAVFADKKKKKGFPCGVCGKVFCRRQHLARHMRTHADVKMEDKMVPKMEDKMVPKMEDKMVPCDVCGEVVSGKEWGRHRKTHDQGQIFQCSWEGCSLAFKDRKLWQDHMSFVHKGQRSVPCTWIGCDKTFPKHSQMERHLKVHITPRRMFSCPVCHKVFRHKPNLSVHMRMHSGETPFKCPHCDYRGRQQSALKWHMKKHHDTIVTSFVSFKMDDAAAVPEQDDLTSKLAEKMWRESGPTSARIPLVSYM
ncbi:PREDICTED: zinc finger and SCAN domain-containing protein 2-like isoform X1 [Branchiostoma belcheri]|uniref:Zinc finger and SCAN domain-containing protein 2-like isoform X1 n=1 Tax=Branchiostoma belcheri TaxID=7741 RepID=A0A6P4ZCW1_BRABE|nr:PREDICTED: zinc finger and SCAN domain-containing protein 2-like isoform X1 [Branchiostoma belcheri]